MLVAVPGFADTPTTEQVVAAAREAAIEAKSRHYMLEVARRTQEFDPEQALKDYRAAAEMPLEEHVTGGWALDSDCQVAEGLVELGDAESAAQLVRAGIDNMGEVKAAPTDDIGSVYTMRIMALCHAARMLRPLDRVKSDEALDLAEKTIDEALEFRGGWWTGWEYTRSFYLAALAMKDPEAAYLAALGDNKTGHRYIPIPMLLAMIEVNPATVLANMDEISKSGVLRGERFQSLQTVTGALAAAVFRQDAKEGMELAVRFELDKAADTRVWPPLRGLAEAIRKLGLGDLPLDAKYTKVYQRVVRDLARTDYEMAVQLAMVLGDPKTCGAALGNICEVMAGTDLAKAQEAAMKMVELHDNVGKCADDDLRDAAKALSHDDEEVVPALLERLRMGWSISEPFALWWKHHRAAAEMLLPELSELRQFFAILGVLGQARETLSPEQGRALAEQALALPLFGKDELTTWGMLREVAPFAPDLAQEAWQKLEPLDTAQAKESQLRMRMDALLAIAQGVEEQEPGRSGLEVAEIERLLGAAPEDARWELLYQARLAQIYAYTDGARCKQVAQEILAGLRTAWPGPGAIPAWAEATAALARVDKVAAKTVLADTAELWRTQDDFQTHWFGDTVVAVARWRPEVLIEFAQSAAPVEDMGSFGYWPNILVSVAEERLDEPVMMVIKAWLADAEDKEDAANIALNNLRHRHRAELVPMGLELVASLEEGLPLADALGQAGWMVALASDEQLDRLLERVQAFGPDVPAGIKLSSLQKVVAAKAARDWEGSQELLASLEPDEPKERARVALLILEMMQKTGRVGGPAADDQRISGGNE